MRAGVTNVDVRTATGHDGLAAEAPFDAIVLGGSVAEVPQSLLDQLAVGGRLIAIVGTDITMSATRFTRTSSTHWDSHKLWDAQTAALDGFPEPSRFHF